MVLCNGVNGSVFDLLKLWLLIEEEEDGAVYSVEVCLDKVLGNCNSVKCL